MSFLDEARRAVHDRIAAAIADYDADVGITVELNRVTDGEKALFASPVAFELASELGRNPADIAGEIADAITDVPEFVASVTATGPYVNLHVDEDVYADRVLGDIAAAGDEYGVERGDRLAIIDESSPNIAKPMHIGHLRNTLLSDALNRVLEEQGYEVIADNHLGDWGGQFGNLLYAYTQWGDEEKFAENPIDHLLDLYQRFGQQEAELDGEELETFRDRGREWFVKLEEGDEEAVALWERMREASIARFEETYDILDVEFDEWIGESFYVQEGYTDKVVDMAIGTGAGEEKTDGSVFIRAGEPDPETGEKPEFVILKSDGTTLYSTRDLATILYRNERWDPDEIDYVVASEQDEYFQQLFEAAGKLGLDGEFTHISYGLISLPEGSMSTRRGRIITARDLLDEVEAEALDIVAENNPEMSEAEQERIAHTVALAAVRYENLRFRRERDIVFDMEDAVRFEGKTGPYLQYSHTRARKILEKEPLDTEPDDLVFEGDEYDLVDELARFPRALQRAADDYDPYYVAHYAYELATAFNSFYHSCPVIQADDPDVAASRKVLVQRYLDVMDHVLDILGIDPLDEM